MWDAINFIAGLPKLFVVLLAEATLQPIGFWVGVFIGVSMTWLLSAIADGAGWSAMAQHSAAARRALRFVKRYSQDNRWYLRPAYMEDNVAELGLREYEAQYGDLKPASDEEVKALRAPKEEDE
jgi:hypothetical protein